MLMKKELFMDFFEDVESEEAYREYDGYYYTLAEGCAIAVLGSLCGLKSVKKIHQWADSEVSRRFLKENFQIERIPCYYWFLTILKMVKPESLAQSVQRWAESVMPEKRNNLTIAIDGKTVRSTEKMKVYKSSLHIISAQLSELGVTLGSKTADGKGCEIAAVQELIRELDIAGCLVVADALNCQKGTAKAIVEQKADYLLCVKENQPELYQNLSEYVQDEQLRKEMETTTRLEKNRDRIERRTAYVTQDIAWLDTKNSWTNLASIGVICKRTETNGVKTEDWHYYISSRKLTAEELLRRARMGWSVESMHWLLDVHFSEDYFRVVNKTIQQNMNILRKFTVSMVKRYKEKVCSKNTALSAIMFNCLLDARNILSVISQN